ncbi:MAG: DUF4340 domain-containing protein [Planctomycetota bacterium]
MRGLLVMVLLVAGLGYGLWRTERRAAREDVPTEALLAGRRTFDATRLVLQRAPDAQPLHFAHASPVDPFRMVEPVEDLASRAFLEQVAGALDSAQRFLDGRLADIASDRLAQMGLDAPRARVELRYPDKTIQIAIGLEGPLHQDVYVAMDGYAYRTGLAVYSVLQANTDDARERLVFRTPLGDVRRLVLRRRRADAGGGNNDVEVIEIERRGMADFRLLQPLQTQADPKAAAALMAYLAGMAVDQFLGELNPMPEWDVQIEMQGAGSTERVTVWHTPQGLIAQQEPRGIAFNIVSADYSRTFEVPVQDLRGRILVPIEMQDIGRIEIDPGAGVGDRIQLRRSFGKEMRMFQPIEGDTEPVAINELLQATRDLSVQEFVDVPDGGLAAVGLDRGFLTLSLHPFVQETQATVLHLGRDDGEFTYVRRDGESYVAKVSRAAAAVFRRAWPEYVSRKLGMSVPATATEIRYVRGGQNAAVLQRTAAQKWVRQDNGADVSDLASEILELLGSVRGKRVLDAQDPSVQAELQASQGLEVDIGTAGGGSLRSLWLFDRGRDAGGQRPAWLRTSADARTLLELGVTDSSALLAPLQP